MKQDKTAAIFAALREYEADVRKRVAECVTYAEKFALWREVEDTTQRIGRAICDIDEVTIGVDLCNVECQALRAGMCEYHGEDKFSRCPRYLSRLNAQDHEQ